MSQVRYVEDLNPPIITRSARMEVLVDELYKVAKVREPVFIRGERGTGRDLIARMVHNVGVGPDQPFQSLSACTLETLDDERRIAEQVSAALENCRGGSLVIRETCDLPREVQRDLLHRIAQGIEARLIFIAEDDVDIAARAGAIDHEFFVVLNRHVLDVPALRNRQEDIAELARIFGRHFSGLRGKSCQVERAAIARLAQYPWPGNVGELKNTMRRLVFRCSDGDEVSIGLADVDRVLPRVTERVPMEELSFEDCVRDKIRAFLQQTAEYPVTTLYSDFVQRVERPMLDLVMKQTGGNQVRAAEILGLNRNTLRRKLTEHGLPTRRASS